MQEQIRQIAMRLKGLRELEGIEAKDLAAEFDIPFDTYISYESGEVDIPVSFLYEVADKFGMELTEILTGENPKLSVYCRVKKGEGLSVDRRKEYVYQNLAYNFRDKLAEPFLVTVEPKGDEFEIHENRHDGQEYNYMLEGRLEIKINGKTMILEEGDSIYFDAKFPHGMKALDGKPARFLAIIMH